ncbi:flagellar biosynthetic protein FliO [Mesorhizobium sp. BAC0120]|uniref:flagellar biosynthetic protein FliO n=1 Tax=Mesorhizobium sp. BAC0120 TaxID=3090670 RepID=UPI00298BF904|nr:flagellar biosynthetic protein FliO [Mesorhizobium sp. BAC0120]MDW6026471.1 flagellar biosynthetic protein FliO [Mesorhizobium sp. BAC0120]
MDWLNDVAGPNFAPAVLWTVLALVVLVIVLIVIRIFRSMTFGTFVAGGRNRKTRLAVMDAAAVDSQRRLVLVRRDDVEHLILIGGPTDVVVERDIRLHTPSRRPAGQAEPLAEAPARQRPPETPQPRSEPQRPVQQPVRTEARPAQPAQQSAPSQPAKTAAAPATPAAPAAKAGPVRLPPAQEPNFSMPRTPPPPPSSGTGSASIATPAAPRVKPVDPPKAPASDSNRGDANQRQKSGDLSLEDEMNRLLGELSNKK